MPKNIYKLKTGEVVPGVTTIINQLDKPALVQWAWKLGKEGKDWRTERDSAGDIGTLVHKCCIDFLSGAELLITENNIVADCVEKFLDWWGEEAKDRDTGLVITETPLVSEKYRFGGTPDIFLVLKNKHSLEGIRFINT